MSCNVRCLHPSAKLSGVTSCFSGFSYVLMRTANPLFLRVKGHTHLFILAHDLTVPPPPRSRTVDSTKPPRTQPSRTLGSKLAGAKTASALRRSGRHHRHRSTINPTPAGPQPPFKNLYCASGWRCHLNLFPLGGGQEISVQRSQKISPLNR